MGTEKYNILYISSFASLQGGGQRSLYLIIKYLNKDKFKPFLVVPNLDELSEEAQSIGIEVCALSFPKVRSLNVLRTAAALMKLHKVITRWNIDLIHTDAPRETFYAFLAGKFSGKKVVFHARVTESQFWLDKILYRLSDYIIAVSDAVGSRFELLDKQGKVKVIYNGVDLDIYKPSDKRVSNEDKLRIGYFGRIDRRKGIEVIIRAVQMIDKNIELLVMGDGDLQYLKELKSISPAGKVTFKNYQKDILRDIAGVDIIVLPSLKGEGLPRILIECMAMGKIAVTSDVPPHKEVLGDELCDFLFTPGDSNMLRSMVEKIADNKQLLDAKKDKIRQRAVGYFDIVKTTKEIEDIYKNLL